MMGLLPGSTKSDGYQLVLLRCVLSPPASTQPWSSRFLSTFCLVCLLTSFMGKLISISLQDFALAHTARTAYWLADRGTVLEWPGSAVGLESTSMGKRVDSRPTAFRFL